MRSGRQQSTRTPIHLYGSAPVGGSRADQHTSQRNTRHTHATRLRPAPQQPKTRVFKHLPAAGKHTRGSPATSPPAATAGARAGRTPLADREPRLSPTRSPSPSTSTTQASDQGPCRLGRAHGCAKKLLYGRLPPPISAREAHHLAQIATTDFVHLQHSDAAVVAARYAKGAMGRGPEDSAAPATASLAAAQQQKPKTVSRGWSGPAGQRGRWEERSGAHLNRRGWR